VVADTPVSRRATSRELDEPVTKAGGEKECLLCNEKIPKKAEIWNLEIGISVMGIVEVPKNEELHLGCGEDFSFKLEALAKEVR